MIRFYLGLALLAALLAGGLFLSNKAERIQAPVTAHLEAAAEAALSGDWAQAERHTAQARQKWEETRSVTASFSDHEPMEQVDSEFSRLEAFLRQRDPGEFTAACAGLSRLTKAIAEAQAVAWWSFL